MCLNQEQEKSEICMFKVRIRGEINKSNDSLLFSFSFINEVNVTLICKYVGFRVLRF